MANRKSDIVVDVPPIKNPILVEEMGVEGPSLLDQLNTWDKSALGQYSVNPPIPDMGAVPVGPDQPAIVGSPSTIAPDQLVLPPEAPVAPPPPEVTTTTGGSTSTGSTTTTSGKDKSADTTEAEADFAEGAEAEKAAIGEEAKAKEAEMEAEAKINERNNDLIASVEMTKAVTRQQGLEELQNDIKTKDALATALANQKPETFWGSKETSDKITSAISIGLGSLGQAMLGSGQNVGQVLLERQMSEFDRNQERKFQAKVKQIESMNTSIAQKQALLKEADLVKDAHKVAGLAQIQSQLGRGLAQAKTASVKAALGQKMALIDQNLAKVNMEQAGKYEKQITDTQTRNEVKNLQTTVKTGGAGAGGKPKNLTEGQAKARLAYADIASTNAALKNMDVNKMTLSPEYQAFMKEKRADDTLKDLPMGMGELIRGPRNAIFGSPDEVAGAKNPELIALDRAIDAWTQGVIRFKSGAAIAVQEFGKERNQYWPTLGDTPESAKVKERNRMELEKAMRQAGALDD